MVWSGASIGSPLAAGSADESTTKAAAVTDAGDRQCAQIQTAGSINVACPPYNAVADDRTDDSKAFQLAVDSLPRSGGIIRIPAGTYVFNQPLIIQKPVQLLGAGPATILSHSGDLGSNGQANFIRIGGAGHVTEKVIIGDLTMQGPERSKLRTTMIRIANNVDGVQIRNVGFRHVSSTCVLLFGGNIRNIDVSDNRADEFYEQFVELASGGIRGVRIERNVANSSRGHPNLGSTEPFGVIFEPKGPGEIADVSIVGNTISFDGMTMSEAINSGGISLSTGGEGGSAFVYRRVLIKDNLIRSAGTGVRVQTLRSGRGGGAASVAITGNRVDSAASYGILVTAGGDGVQADRVSITGNIIRGYSAQSYYQYDAIRLDGNIFEPEITGNQVLPPTGRESGYGRYGISIEAGVRKPLLKDNQIAGFRDGAVSNKSSNGRAQQ